MGDLTDDGTAPEFRNVRSRGETHHLHCWGDKDAPLVVLLHGWGDTGCSFQFVASGLADACRLVAPDWRGFGHSNVRQRLFWFPEYLADLDHLLDTLSPDAPVRLVGHSMGANVAALYAGIRPHRIASLVNIEGFGLPDSAPDAAPERYATWLSRVTEARPFRRFSDFSALATHLSTRYPRLGASRAEVIARCWGRQTDEHVELRMHPGHRLPNPVLYRRAEAEACWKNTTAEYLLVAGKLSEFATAEHLHAVLRHVPHAQSVVLDGAGHMLHFDVPDALATEIRRFLRL